VRGSVAFVVALFLVSGCAGAPADPSVAARVQPDAPSGAPAAGVPPPAAEAADTDAPSWEPVVRVPQVVPWAGLVRVVWDVAEQDVRSRVEYGPGFAQATSWQAGPGRLSAVVPDLQATQARITVARGGEAATSWHSAPFALREAAEAGDGLRAPQPDAADAGSHEADPEHASLTLQDVRLESAAQRHLHVAWEVKGPEPVQSQVKYLRSTGLSARLHEASPRQGVGLQQEAIDLGVVLPGQTVELWVEAWAPGGGHVASARLLHHVARLPPVQDFSAGAPFEAPTIPPEVLRSLLIPPMVWPEPQRGGGEAPTVPPPPTPAPPAPMRVTSLAYASGSAIPAKHTCDGADTSMPFTVHDPPAGTQRLAWSLTDLSAGGFVHWLAWDLPATLTSVTQGVDVGAAGGREGRNDFGDDGYGGPCPPPNGPHTYRLTVHALSSPLALPSGATHAQFASAVASRTLATATYDGTYTAT